MRPLPVAVILVAALPFVACAKKKKSSRDDDRPTTGSPTNPGSQGTDEDEEQRKTGYPNGSPWTRSDGTRDLTIGPNLEDCTFDRFGEIAGVTSNFDFKPVCSEASFGSLGHEGFGTPGEPFLYEWKVDLSDRPGIKYQKTAYTSRRLSISYWGQKERFPVEEGVEYTAAQGDKGYFRVTLSLPKAEDGNTFTSIEDWSVTVLKAPKAKHDKLKMRYSVAGKTSFEKDVTTSGEIELEMCNEPNSTDSGCSFWFVKDGT